MEKFLIVAIGLIVGTTLGAYIIFYSGLDPLNLSHSEVVEEESTDEPYHEHVDLRIVVEGQTFNLTQPFFQSDSYDYRDQHLHLHDDNGDVAHLHQEGATLNDFLRSIDMELSDTCLSIGLLEPQPEPDSGEVQSSDSADTREEIQLSTQDRGSIFQALGLEEDVSDVPQLNYCKGTNDNTLAVYVNGQQRLEMGSYALQDLDQVLVYYGPPDQALINAEIENVTDQACIYSLVCPERGTPPEEACISSADSVCGVESYVPR